MKQLCPNHIPGWLDNARSMAVKKAQASLPLQLLLTDPAVAIWMLHANCHCYSKATPEKAGVEVKILGGRWATIARELANQPDCFQLLLQDKDKGPYVFDMQLLVRARQKWKDKEAAAACADLALLLERCCLKEQLAAGSSTVASGTAAGSTIMAGAGNSQEPAPVASGTLPAAGPAAAVAVAAIPAGPDDSFSHVRPLPPDVYLQLLEVVTSAALLGLPCPTIYLPSSCRSHLLDPVLLPLPSGADLSSVAKLWQSKGVLGAVGRMLGVRGSGESAASAEGVLGRCLRVAYQLASVNWNHHHHHHQQQQQQEERYSGSGDPTTAQEATAAITATADTSTSPEAAAVPRAAAATTTTTSSSVGGGSRLIGGHSVAAPLVFAEHLGNLAAAKFDVQLLYNSIQQQQSLQQQPKAVGAVTACLMPILAARCALLFSCVVLSLAAGSPVGGGGGSGGGVSGGGGGGQKVWAYIRPAAQVAKAMAKLALQLSEQQQQQQQQWRPEKQLNAQQEQQQQEQQQQQSPKRQHNAKQERQQEQQPQKGAEVGRADDDDDDKVQAQEEKVESAEEKGEVQELGEKGKQELKGGKGSAAGVSRQGQQQKQKVLEQQQQQQQQQHWLCPALLSLVQQLDVLLGDGAGPAAKESSKKSSSSSGGGGGKKGSGVTGEQWAGVVLHLAKALGVTVLQVRQR